MRILARLTLLSLFAATGVALAIYVGTSLSPSQAGLAAGPSVQPPPADPGKQLALAEGGQTVSPPGNLVHTPSQQGAALVPAEAEEASPQSAPATEDSVAEATAQREAARTAPWTPETADSVPPRPALTVPEGPVVAESYPARAFQHPSSGPRLGLPNTLRFWKRLAGPLLAQVAPDAGPPAQAPAPLPPVVEQPAEPPAAPPLPPVAIPSAISLGQGEISPGQSAVGPGIVGEGDGQLQMQFPDKDIREVLDALSIYGDLNILATDSVKGNVSATFSGTDVESALDALLKSTGYVARRDGDFIYVGKSEDFDSLEKALDMVGTRVYRPNYVTAAELQALIEPLVTTGTGVVAVSSPAEVGIGADATNAGGDAYAGGDVVVVRDYEAVLAEIDQVVTEIDVRPMQVAIEAMILSVTLDDEDTFGASFELLRDKQHIRLGWGSPIQTISDVDFSSTGLEVGFLDSSLSVFFEALERIGDTNVVATPRLMVLNKHKAEILIGEELGYVSTTMTETATSQNVEFLEVGAQLRLRPFISSDGLIRMEVHPELSTGFVETSEKFTLPNKKTTQVTTNIMVRDGCTVVIGGLMREELQASGSQVPFFGNLPLVGVAFRNRKEVLQRREILVLITPHIVYEPETCEEGERSACEFHRREEVYRDKMNPLGKRHVARRYFRLAQNAWADGDRDRALRFAELAIHFDPLNRAAIDLRSDIWVGRPVGDHTLQQPAPVLTTTTPLDATLIDPWLLDELGGDSLSQPQSRHPLDPGRPGRRVDIQRPRRFQ